MDYRIHFVCLETQHSVYTVDITLTRDRDCISLLLKLNFDCLTKSAIGLAANIVQIVQSTELREQLWKTSAN